MKMTQGEVLDSAMAVAHQADRIGNFDLPHIMTHIKGGLKAKTMSMAQRQFKHLERHGESLQEAASHMAPRVLMVPGVKEHINDLRNSRTKTQIGLRGAIINKAAKGLKEAK